MCNKETCDICKAFAGFETSPEGNKCESCDNWVCNDCTDYKEMDNQDTEDTICKECSGNNLKTVHELDRQTVDFYNKALASNKAIESYKECDKMESFTIAFENEYQVDFNLVNGDQDCGAWLDVILFDERGDEISCLAPEHQQIEGQYIFNLEDKKYIVEIVLK